VSLNHRLNIFGFLYLGDIGGARYADSGNVGLLDIVLALNWVRENIAAFGGDPNNVTIFGESGGGGKVAALMAMPPAKGLFHKAIIESGPYLRAIEREAATETTERVLQRLQLRPTQVDELCRRPVEELLRAMDEVKRTESGPYWLSDWLKWDKQFAPVLDGHTLTVHPFDPVASNVSAHVPLIVGTTGQELSSYDRSFGEKEFYARLKAVGLNEAQSAQLASSYRARRPGTILSDIFYDIASDKIARLPAIQQAQRKAALGSAPVYMYLFAFDLPAHGGKYRSPHGMELPFVFDNLEQMPGLIDESQRASEFALATNASRAWAAFARSGNPSHAGLPEWLPYTASSRATMVMNLRSQLVHDPRGEDRRVMESALG